jgi:glucose/arabinose dehydrogenase
MLRKLGAAGALLSLLLGSPRASATVVDPDFTDVVFATKVGTPTAMAWAPDGSSRLFVTSKVGDVWILQDGKLLPTPFVNISPIETNSECGLLGIAFDPDFITNQYVYLFVTVSPSEQQIVRYTANGNVAEAPRVILAGLPTRGLNHDGGALAFGPDGKLYFAIGDNGNRLGVGADLTLFNAKVSRLNRDGSVPSDNPFVDGDGPNNDYIWARGFRNPFTMTFQPSTVEGSSASRSGTGASVRRAPWVL